MNILCKKAGEILLSIASAIDGVGVASMNYCATEEMPESMKNAR